MQGGYLTQRWSVDEDLPVPRVTDAVRGPGGYLWMNGEANEVFRVADGTFEKGILALAGGAYTARRLRQREA